MATNIKTDHKVYYVATAGDNKVVTAEGAFIHKIIFGADVANAVVELSDHPSDGDGNIKFQFNGSTLMTSTAGGVEINGVFPKGICFDSTNQTQISVVWSPLS